MEKCVVLRRFVHLPFFSPETYFVGRSRQVAEYNDYTNNHLPVNNPDLPKNEEATFAILAALIAFSNRETRSVDK